MTREQANEYLRCSGFSEEQINTIADAFTCGDAEIQADYDAQKATGMTDEEWEYGGDAVSRQAVLDALGFYDGYNQQHFTVDNLRDDIQKLPSVQPKRQVNAEWIDWLCRLRSEINSGMDMASIPKNHRDKLIDVLTDVIDVLGADMRGAE